MNDWIELRGKTALVTGGARRLGATIARGLAGAGANVAVHYRHSASEAEALVEELRGMGVRAMAVAGDLDDPSSAPRILDTASAALGPLDFLVNNASIFPADSLPDLTPEAVHHNVDVNALAPLSLALALGRALAASGRPGAIVNLLDTRITDYDRDHLSYHLSKRMLHTLTKILALELAPLVRVNAVAPGLVLPPEGKDEAYLASLAHSNPLQSYGGEANVREAVLFLLQSGFVTGQVIYVDGGRNLRRNLYG
ncbi:MAG: SDR family oxidoreductase [Polyangia bacterium]|jgi:NAD(P)-dependent dehydrogenase (short-subunit alcohol dehydrogenase family)|nr:SDR family oxidoreductase [Polyangia bacterium]